MDESQDPRPFLGSPPPQKPPAHVPLDTAYYTQLMSVPNEKRSVLRIPRDAYGWSDSQRLSMAYDRLTKLRAEVKSAGGDPSTVPNPLDGYEEQPIVDWVAVTDFPDFQEIQLLDPYFEAVGRCENYEFIESVSPQLTSPHLTSPHRLISL